MVNAGTRTNVQWKISPDNSSEHPIEIQDPDGYDSPFANVTVHCIDIQNYADDAKRVGHLLAIIGARARWSQPLT